jgi:hypothetical protein
MAAAGNVAFTIKDLFLLAVSFYLLKQDVLRVVSATPVNGFIAPVTTAEVRAWQA